jgi:UDP-2,3-diacylglucosamine pyrophosphatase LpxH
LAQGIAHLSRQQSRNHQLNEVMEKFAIKKLNEFDVVILAHSHIPVFRIYSGDKYYINTGDWVNNFSYVKLENGKVSLNYYK